MAVDPLQTFAGNLRRVRAEAGLTQETLSERSGVDLASVGRIERGTRDPGIRTVARLASGLGCQPEDLVRGVPPHQQDGH